MIKYTVYINDDRFEFETRKRFTMSDICKKYNCTEEEIVAIYEEEA